MSLSVLSRLLRWSHALNDACVIQMRYDGNVPVETVSPKRTRHSRAGADAGKLDVAAGENVSVARTWNATRVLPGWAGMVPLKRPSPAIASPPVPLSAMATLVCVALGSRR